MADETLNLNESDKTLDVSHPDKTLDVSQPDQTLAVTGAETAGPKPAEGLQVLAKFGSYEILDEIARGGVGVVYKARQPRLNRIVALKILQSGLSASSEQVQRFSHEARAAAKLQHPNIVPIHDFGTQDGQHYFTMDYIEGESLADVLARGALPARAALELVRQVSDALHYAHEQGVIHRDIKPGNILIDKSGRVQVTDFGLAKEVQSEELSLTATGQVMGTPRYMSPEQAVGRTAHADGRSDVFSLGVTLYEMLTGRPAFAGESVIEMLQKIVGEEPKPPHRVNPKVHRDIETICLKAIEKSPDQRYQSAFDLTQDIERFLAGEPIEAKPVGLLGKGLRRMRRHRKALAIYAVGLFLTINGIVLALNARPATLQLQVDRPGAVVRLDGAPHAVAAFASGFPLKAGTYQVRVEDEPLYHPREFEVVTRPGQTRDFSVSLARRTGVTRVVVDPPDAGVTLVGEDGYRATFQGPVVEQSLPTGAYTLLAHKENFLARGADFTVASAATNEFAFTLLSITLWSAATSGNVLSVPAVDDFNGDGAYDTVVGDDDGNIYCFSGRNGIALWVYRAQEAVQAPISKADFNGDGRPDVAVGGTDGRVYCLDGREGQALWTATVGGAIHGPALVADLNGDGTPDVIVGAEDGKATALAGKDGATLWQFETRGAINSCLAWHVEDGQPVALIGSADKWLYALNARTGAELWKVEVGEPLQFPPRLEDSDQTGKLVALLPTPTEPGDARTRTPVELATRKVLPAITALTHWVDLDGDGRKEKLTLEGEGTSCYEADGVALRWRAPYIAVGAHFADVTGDGTLDLVFNNGPDQLICLSGQDGQPVGRITLDGTVARGYALEDVDRDGVPDLVVGVGRKVHCFSWVGGRQQWRATAESYFDAGLATTDGLVFAKTIGGVISARAPDKAEPLWEVATSEQPSPYAGVDAGSGLVVDADARTRRLAAFNAVTGELVWSAILPGKDGAPIGAPTILGDSVVVGDGATGVHCFGLADGALRWQQSLPKVTARAVADEASVFIPDGAAALHCLNRQDGAARWAFPASDPFPAPPALVDINGDGALDAVAVGDNGFVYALDGRSGRKLWELQLTTLRTRTRHRVAVADVTGDGFPEGFVVSLRGNVICLDLRVGKPKWIHSLRERVMSEPVLGDVNGDGVPDVLVGTMARRLHCLDGRGTGQLWSQEVGAQIRYSHPLYLPAETAQERPRVLVATGPPENGLYCLDATATAGPARWHGPWTALTTVFAPGRD